VAAASGVTRYQGTAFGAEYRDNLFSALFNLHAVRRHVLERDGDTFRSRNEDFLVSTSPDFHPTDVLEDADGSLLIVDSGSWFEHCPTSKIGKGPVKGGIYRIRRSARKCRKSTWKRSCNPPARRTPRPGRGSSPIRSIARPPPGIDWRANSRPASWMREWRTLCGVSPTDHWGRLASIGAERLAGPPLIYADSPMAEQLTQQQGAAQPEFTHSDDSGDSVWVMRAMEYQLLAHARDISRSINTRVNAILTKYHERDNGLPHIMKKAGDRTEPR
jgi:hypothetical protein